MRRLAAVLSELGVMLTLAVCAVSASAGITSGQSGGTITFTGRIVAPPYTIHVAGAVPTGTGSDSIGGTAVRFVGNDGQRARVRADSVDHLPLVFRCADAHPMRSGHCQFGPGGGTLTIADEAATGVRAPRRAVLTVAYD